MTHFTPLSAMTLLLFASGCGFEPAVSTDRPSDGEVDSQESGFSEIGSVDTEEALSLECESDIDCEVETSCFAARCDLGICFLNPIMDCEQAGDGDSAMSGDGGGDGGMASETGDEGGQGDVFDDESDVDLIDGALEVGDISVDLDGTLDGDSASLYGDLSLGDDSEHGLGVDLEGTLGSTGERDDSILGIDGMVSGSEREAIVDVDGSVDSDGSDLDIDGDVFVDTDSLVEPSMLVDLELEVDVEDGSFGGASGESMACGNSMDCSDRRGCTVDICLQSDHACIHAMVDGCAESDDGAVTILEDAVMCRSPLDCVDDDGCSLDICVEPLGLCAHLQAEMCSLDDPLLGFGEQMNVVDDGVEMIIGSKDHLVSVLCPGDAP